jgi:hypothetical protein
MIRWLVVLAALLLSGCVTTREVVYRDRYHQDGYADARYYDDGSYYAAPQSGRGDYYYRAAPRYDYGYGYDAWYWDYPAYYSVFWPLYRSWYDPFRYPGYYYGVTYYPRNYFSLSFHGGWGWPGYGHYYSPYRYSWVDNYYDWSPWHRRGRHHHEAPRYGSARNEAERLARMGDYGRHAGSASAYSGGDRRSNVYDRYGSTRDPRRGADYGGGTAARQDPGFRGFGVRTPDDGVRRVGGGTRQAPIGSAFEAPQGDTRYGRSANYGRDAAVAPAPRGGWSAERTPSSAARREAGRWDSYPAPRSSPRYERAPRGYALPGPTDNGGVPVATPRQYGRPASVQPYRGEGRAVAAPRGYEVAPGGYAPAPRYEPRAEPRFESRPEPRYEARPEPRYESRPEPSYSREESRGDDGGDVRRVGSNRED